MSHIRAIVNYVKVAVIVTIQGGTVARIAKELPKAAVVVNWINPVVTVEILPTNVVYGVWDRGQSLWDQDINGVPQSQWDIDI